MTPLEFRRRVYGNQAPLDVLAAEGETLLASTASTASTGSTGSTASDERAGLMLDVALVLTARVEAAGLDADPDPADLRRADQLLGDALAYPHGRRDGVAILVNRSTVLLWLFERDNDAEHLEEAIRCLESARAIEGDYSTTSPVIHTMLGSLLLRRAEVGVAPGLVDESVEWLERAARATDDDSADWLGRHVNLANGLLRQAERGNLDALDRVIGLADELVSKQQPGGPGEQDTLLVAARASRLLSTWTDAPEAMDRAIEFGRRVVALGVHREAGVRGAGNLGNALVQKASVHHGSTYAELCLLDEAVEVLTMARAGMRGRPADYAQQTANLGRALVVRYGATHDAEDLRSAADMLAQVATGPVLNPALIGQAEVNLGLVYLSLADATAAGDELRSHAEQIVLTGLARIDPHDDPGLVLEAGRLFGERLVAQGRHARAAEVLSVALEALETVLGQVPTAEPDRLLARTEGLVPLAAYALALAGRAQDAVVVIEQGRARGLRKALGLNDREMGALRRAGYAALADAHIRVAESLARSVDGGMSQGSSRRRLLVDRLRELQRQIRTVPGFSDFAVAPDLASIRVQAEPDPLVYGCVTPHGGVLLVVDREDNVVAVPLPELTDAALQQHSTAYLEATHSFRNAHNPGAVLQPWLDAVENCSQWLGDVFAQSLCSTMDRIGATGAVLVLPGLLGLLPVTVAVVGPADERLAERLVVRLAPSAVGLRAAREVARGSECARVLAVGGPTSATLPTLAGAAAEAVLVATSFSQSTTLTGESATKPAVVAALPNHDVVHLACHAIADVAQPLEGCVMLADDEALPLAEILRLRLWRMRLCFLSACDSGVVGREVPDEVVSFPVGLIQAGAAGVIASMWPVRDTAAAVLAAAFYRRWPTTEPDPARALRDAQLWLRHATTVQADELLVELLPDVERNALIAANGTRPTDRAFPLVVDWSAFTYVGA